MNNYFRIHYLLENLLYADSKIVSYTENALVCIHNSIIVDIMQYITQYIRTKAKLRQMNDLPGQKFSTPLEYDSKS